MILSLVHAVEKITEYAELLPPKRDHVRTVQENIEELLIKPLRNDRSSERFFVRFFLLIATGQFDEACEFVFICIRLLWMNLPCDINAHIRSCHHVRDSVDCSQEEKSAYHRDVEACLILSQLQMILEVRNASSAARGKHSGSSHQFHTATLSNVEIFFSTYCSLIPMLAFVVRVSLSMLCVMHRFLINSLSIPYLLLKANRVLFFVLCVYACRPDVAGMVMAALRNNDSVGGINEKGFCAAMKRMTTAATQPSENAEQPLEQGGGKNQISPEAFALEMGLLGNDAGAQYIFKVDRDQANSVSKDEQK